MVCISFLEFSRDSPALVVGMRGCGVKLANVHFLPAARGGGVYVVVIRSYGRLGRLGPHCVSVSEVDNHVVRAPWCLGVKNNVTLRVFHGVIVLEPA